jgi:hypothetical protein
MAALEEALKSDRAPSKVLQFNDFGLVAITRKRVKQSLERTLSVPHLPLRGHRNGQVARHRLQRDLHRDAQDAAGFADFLFRGQFVAFAGDGHGLHHFRSLTGGRASDILRGDLESVQQQTGLARIDAGTKGRSYYLGERDLNGRGILQHRELDVIEVGAFRLGHGMRTRVEITVSRLDQSRRLASLPVGFDVTTELIHRLPPPVFCKQNLCFHEVTGIVAL